MPSLLDMILKQPVPENVTLLRNIVIADVISLDKVILERSGPLIQ